MKSVFLFLVITFSTINANAQLGDLFRKLADTIDAVTKQNKVEEVNKEEESKVNKSEDLSEVFVKKEGQTIAQINSEASLYCNWKDRKKDRKYIILEAVYPDFENLQVYKSSMVDEELMPSDYKDVVKRRCNERMYFIEGKLVPINKINEMEIKYNKSVTADLKDLLLGRWASPIVCNTVTNRKGGTYISLNNNQELITQNFDPTSSSFVSETIINRLERFSVDGKNLLKLSGIFSNNEYKNIKDERIWDITNISNNKIYGVDRKINNQQTFKDGVDLRSGQKVAYIEKCGAQNNNQITGQAPKPDNSQSSNVKKISFGIKGIELGGSVPVGFNCTNDKYYSATNRKTCFGKTTVLEVPYNVTIVLIDEKIDAVRLYDDIWGNEWSIANGRKKPNEDLWDRERRFGKLTTINDFSIYMNDLVKNIIERIDDSKKTPKVEKKEIKSLESFSATMFTGIVNSRNNIKIFENKLSSSKEKQLSTADNTLYQESKELIKNANMLLSVLESQCKSCKSSSYDFSWDMGEYLIKIKTTMPETKEDPFPFYSSLITYNTKDAPKTAERLDTLHLKLEEDELKGIADFNKKIEVQKNENRKKDF